VQDVPILRAMLVDAFNWRDGGDRLPADAGKFLDAWGRTGDLGVIADGDVGAAWVRLFTEDEHSYGYVAPHVPELTIAVAKEARGRGIGTALLRELLPRIGHVSLSVETDNPAVRLYERFGFVRVGYVGTSWTMQRWT
jgi:[ribosomal protein S18]-alanine N-acetyltransferase